MADWAMTARLKAGLFVRAIIRRAEVAGAQAYVARKGSEEAGAVFIKIAKLDGTCTVLNQARDAKGDPAWARPLGEWVEEAKASAYFERQIKFDPDLWILEIEDRLGRTFVDEPVL
jgi:hypothetical protein